MSDPIHPLKAPELKPASDSPLDAGSQALSEALRSSFVIVKAVMIILVLVFFGSGFFTVGPQERAIILRFGKPVGEGRDVLLSPGLHWSLPYPIDEVVLVSISGLQQVRSTAGWYATTPAAEAAGTEPIPGADAPINPAEDGYVLTADNNIIHSRVTLTYRVEDDPIPYVFSFMNASIAIQYVLNDALIHTASHYGVDDILTRDVMGFNDAVRRRVEALIRERKLGIIVEQCAVQSIAPRQLKGPFQSVTDAELARSKTLNEARSYEAQTLSRASGDSQARVNAAESERSRTVNDVASRSEQFLALLPKYQANPQLFTQQRLLDTLTRVMTNAQDKIFVSERADGKPKELRLLLNPDPRVRSEENK